MNKVIHIHGDGQQTRCYTHVEDIANDILCIMESKQIGVLNIAGEEEDEVPEEGKTLVVLGMDEE